MIHEGQNETIIDDTRVLCKFHLILYEDDVLF
jgi:hypothetical protein